MLDGEPYAGIVLHMFGAPSKEGECVADGFHVARHVAIVSNGLVKKRRDFTGQPITSFPEEWRRMLTQLDMQYVNILNEYKQELAVIA